MNNFHLNTIIMLSLIFGVCCNQNKFSGVIEETSPERVALTELGTALMIYRDENQGRWPNNWVTLNKYKELCPSAISELKENKIIMLTKNGFDNTDVVAFEKNAPNHGGWVLLGDNKTTKKMAPEELKNLIK